MNDSATSPFLSNRVPVCPPDLLARAKTCPTSRVAIANAGALIPMQAAKVATELGLITPLFTGNAADIQRIAAHISWDISAYTLLEAPDEASAGAAAAHACGEDQADILMKGDIHSDTFLRSALARDAGLRSAHRLVHIFHITHPDGGRPILISDAAVNVSPDMETLEVATSEVVSLLHKLGEARPKIAFLSATETPTKAVPSSVSAAALCEWARASLQGADFSGPLALDLILSPKSAELKHLGDDPVAGFADAVIVPDIVSGNALFKSLVYLAGGCAAGLVTGAKVPLLLTSRADPPAARLASIALAVVAANQPSE